MVNASIVRRHIVVVKKETFLHYGKFDSSAVEQGEEGRGRERSTMLLTSLEARDRRGDFDAAGQKVGQPRKGDEEEKP